MVGVRCLHPRGVSRTTELVPGPIRFNGRLTANMLDLGLLFITSLLLGMRHATDADHIVAVSTIACRERSAWRASAVGALWGLGHTLTILVVGGAIVLFKMAFTPRVGLSLELTVAVMLIVLGVLNLLDFQWKPGAL